MTATLPHVRLLVCGNVDRADDGAAIWAVSHLLPGAAADELPGLDVRRCGQLEVEDLVDGGLVGPLLIVDTAVGIRPGRIVTLSFDELLQHTSSAAPRSSHSLPIDQVIGVARHLADGPVDGLFVGIGAGDVSHGRSLSKPVREAMGEYVVAIEKALMCLISMSVPASARHD
jgi:hydrogenase maturation protease